MEFKNKCIERIQKYPLVAALFTQIIVLFFLRNIFVLFSWSIPLSFFVFIQALLCSLIGRYLLNLPRWFLYISFLFPFSFFLATQYLHFSSGIYGFIFLLLALTFSHTLKERVPLYLTNNITNTSLIKFLRDQSAHSVLDLGSGLGGVVRALASHDIKSVGVESAPLLWLFSFLLSKVTGKGVILRQNIWKTDLVNFDVVYAFLSPAIMEKLFVKVKKEMRKGTYFVSNSFAVPLIKADFILELPDDRKTRLYVYKINS